MEYEFKPIPKVDYKKHFEEADKAYYAAKEEDKQIIQEFRKNQKKVVLDKEKEEGKDKKVSSFRKRLILFLFIWNKTSLELRDKIYSKIVAFSTSRKEVIRKKKLALFYKTNNNASAEMLVRLMNDDLRFEDDTTIKPSKYDVLKEKTYIDNLPITHESIDFESPSVTFLKSEPPPVKVVSDDDIVGLGNDVRVKHNPVNPIPLNMKDYEAKE